MQLRKARVDLSISLEEIAEKTGLSQRYLKALEADDYDHLPGKVYIYGYLRRYAALVKVDIDQLLEAFEASYGERNQVTSDTYGINNLKKKLSYDKLVFVLGAGVVLILIVVLMAFG